MSIRHGVDCLDCALCSYLRRYQVHFDLPRLYLGRSRHPFSLLDCLQQTLVETL
jgi:hypothetical protein